MQAYSLMTVVKRMGIENVYIGKNVQVGVGAHSSSILAKVIKYLNFYILHEKTNTNIRLFQKKIYVQNFITKVLT